jgi:U3 small nucleolar ribonucleoprotein protein IMP3
MGDHLLILSRYNKLAGSLRGLAHRLSLLPAADPFRSQMESSLLSKLYDMGLLDLASKMSDVENKITVSGFCRRRLAVVACRMRMAETVGTAVKYIEQGHIRVGPQTITDPAYLVTRAMEDFVTWVDTSKVKRTVMTYNDEVRIFLCRASIFVSKSNATSKLTNVLHCLVSSA